MKLHLLAHRSPSAVWPCSQQATDWYQSIAQGLETPAVCYSTYLLPLGIVTDQFLRRQSSPCLLSKMSPRYILKQLYSIEGNVLFISSLGSPRTSSVTVLHVWQQTKIFFFFSLIHFSSSLKFFKFNFDCTESLLLHRLSSSCIEQQLLSSWGAQAFIAEASLVVEHMSSAHELSSCSFQALKQVQ